MGNKNPRSAYFSPKNWLWGSVSGLNGKRYSQLPVQDYEVNEDGTITAYGGTYNISTDALGRKYFDVLIPEYDSKTKTGPRLNTGFDHIDDSGRIVGRGETYNRYYVGNLLPIQNEEPPTAQTTTEEVPRELLSEPVKSTPSTSVSAAVRSIVSKQLRVPVPELYRQGLAKVENGETYYTFDGYSPEQVSQALAAAWASNPQTSRNYYVLEQLSNTEQQSSTFTRSGLERSIDFPSATKTNDEGAFLYAYPSRTVHVYKVQPEIADIVKQNLKSLPQNKKKTRSYYFTNVPLTKNIPGGELNDSIFHDIYIPSNMSKGTFDIYSQYAGLPEGAVDTGDLWSVQEQIAAGQHSDNEDPILLINKGNTNEDNTNFIRTGVENLVFYTPYFNEGVIGASYITPHLNAEFVRYPSYRDNTGRQHYFEREPKNYNVLEVSVPVNGKPTNTLSELGLPVYSWTETSSRIKLRNTQPRQLSATTTLTLPAELQHRELPALVTRAKETGRLAYNTGKLFFNGLRSRFGFKYGGRINYTKFYK